MKNPHLVVLGILALAPFLPAQGLLNLAVYESDPNIPLPCRVHLAGTDGKPVRAPDLPFWHDHFVCGGKISLPLPDGKYSMAIERGLEYRRIRETFEIKAGGAVEKQIQLKRWADLASDGWWSGELHVHRAPEEMGLHLRAEDLHVAPVITFWNQNNLWKSRPLPGNLLAQVEAARFYHVLAGEDERQGGALLYFNLKSPLDFAGQRQEIPSPAANLQAARQQEGAWVDIEKPFWWDVPAWVAAGADSIGIATNHMLRSGMLPNEAWGRPRDAGQYPPPRGNGFYTQDIYYHLLNCGFRIPPSAGSASGVLPNPVGYNRVYVHLDGPLTYDAWWQGLKRGECFVSNGPALLVQASGKNPGAVFQAQEPLAVELAINAYSADLLEAVEIISNGAPVKRYTFEGRSSRFLGNHTLACKESGWFLVRAIARVPGTFRFASTAPFYVEIGGRPMAVRKEEAQYFIDWIDERMRQIQAGVKEKLADPKELEAVLEPHRKARELFNKLKI
ncbi:MAG: CehA/McbA family metallohydrolase [Planctomycetes bacterium]|nr:CehA/McbA family metallohydrolase [Planctomycetota bacterium]